MDGLVGAVAVSGVLALCASGIVVVERTSSSPLASDAAPEAVVVPVESSEQVERLVAGLTVVSTQGLVARAETGGVLTSVDVKPGDVVETGETVATVADVPLVAMVAAAPLHRDLAPGDAGPDVARLQEFLLSTGTFDGPVDGQAGPSVVEAVRAWNEAHGRSGTTFARASVVWVGPRSLVVDSIEAQAGETIIPGAPLVSAAAEPASVLVDMPALPDGTLGAFELRAGSVVIPYDPATGAVTDPEHVADLVQQIGPEVGAGQVVQLEGTEVLTVPATAVVTDAEGRTCVYPDATADPVAVEPIGGRSGTVDLPLDTAATTVLANPGEIRRLTCAS
ncbi:peptidoglycan-binding domain-containing protein [Sanguibacter antarcticus]|uniref:Putative peptidoglycan binding protein n=1 Tax=Sanguibacter antarcticus TaxID=372484 RepID=A0A2A9E8Z9_9MICO|nr:peptidoglycan-binding domain-containing protein [Sanguibacter antarcticus]PFG34650.1 putative peptidoglycan binding protein [Sanguibacter antarcticus]